MESCHQITQIQRLLIFTFNSQLYRCNIYLWFLCDFCVKSFIAFLFFRWLIDRLFPFLYIYKALYFLYRIREYKKLFSPFSFLLHVYLVFAQTILVIPFHLLEWSKWFENGLKMIWNGLKKNDVELFDFVNFDVV